MCCKVALNLVSSLSCFPHLPTLDAVNGDGDQNCDGGHDGREEDDNAAFDGILYL